MRYTFDTPPTHESNLNLGGIGFEAAQPLNQHTRAPPLLWVSNQEGESMESYLDPQLVLWIHLAR